MNKLKNYLFTAAGFVDSQQCRAATANPKGLRGISASNQSGVTRVKNEGDILPRLLLTKGEFPK